MPTETDPSFIKWIAAGIATTAAGIFAWTGKRQVQRIDTMERRIEERVTRAELKEHVDNLNQSLKEGFSHTRDDIKDLHKRVDDVMRDRK